MPLAFFSIFILLISSLSFSQPIVEKSLSQPPKLRIYDHLMSPREHPDDDRRQVHPPDWDTFGYRTHFNGLRDFKIKGDKIVDYVGRIEKYTRTFDLCDIVWPYYLVTYAKNLNEFTDEIKRRGLFLFDIFGYVPGSGPGGIPRSIEIDMSHQVFWNQFKIPPAAIGMLESKLGDHWLGMDNGEQDGRYVGGFASQMFPSSANRREQYFNFQRHFQKMCDELGNKMATLVSLNFGHYFLKEGVYTFIGAETAQALPNEQVYYSFIRGAGKQYGVPWFGMPSICNRWGFKVYGAESAGSTFGNNFGARKGTSLSLLKRLLYNQILYNCMHVGFEAGWFDGGGYGYDGDHLSPIGVIQQSAHRWVKQQGNVGTMLTPIAVMLDFYSGWSFPRHLYTGDLYRVWGNLPYESGDYLTDGVLDLLYPGYQNASYCHDESGFISPTPYGDAADCILSDSPSWLLDRYPLLVIAGELSGGSEIRAKLQAYIKNGGRLFISAGSLKKLPGGLAGIRVGKQSFHFESGRSLHFGLDACTENSPFDLYELIAPSDARVVVRCGDIPAVIELPSGTGSITVCASPFGIGSESIRGVSVRSEIDKPLVKPFPILKHISTILDKIFRSQMLFGVDKDLSLITCRKGAGLYTLEICNNSFEKKPLRIISHCGPIEYVREFDLDQSDKKAEGYLPEGFEHANIGASDEWNIAGGDVRIFSVKVNESNVESIPHIVPPTRPQDLALPLRGLKQIKEEVLSRPTFFEHFDRVVIDWKYLYQKEKDELHKETGWIGRQKLGIIVDLTSGINLFPTLRLTNNDEIEYKASMTAIRDVLEKMKIIDAHDLIFSLHRRPDLRQGWWTEEQTKESFEATVRELCNYAGSFKITMHLRLRSGRPPYSNWDMNEAVRFIERIGMPNLKLAVNTAWLSANKTDVASSSPVIKGKIGFWLLSAPEFDIAGNLWNEHGTISGYENKTALSSILAIEPDVPIILDAIYKNPDEEYLDVVTIKNLMSLSEVQ